MSPHPGEIWLADLGLAAKTRPVVIVSIFDPDAPRALVIYVPLTTQNRDSPYEVTIPRLGFLNAASYANVQGIGLPACNSFGAKARSSADRDDGGNTTGSIIRPGSRRLRSFAPLHRGCARRFSLNIAIPLKARAEARLRAGIPAPLWSGAPEFSGRQGSFCRRLARLHGDEPGFGVSVYYFPFFSPFVFNIEASRAQSRSLPGEAGPGECCGAIVRRLAGTSTSRPRMSWMKRSR